MVAQADNFIEYLIIEYRWLLVVTLLMPLSLVYKVWSAVRSYIVFKLQSAPKNHDKKVKEVQRQIKAWLATDRSTKLCTARPTWQTMSFRHATYKKSSTNIHINLVDVLQVDTKNMTVRCEPLVTMGQISKTLEPFGLALAVVPEMNEITVGGLVMAQGIESSSHIHGLFQHTCVRFELVLADGSVVTCTKDENPELFYAVPWSYGTLGFLMSVDLKVVPAKKYIRLEYTSHTNLPDLAKHFEEESVKTSPHQFVEAVMFTKDSGVMMTGDMVDEIGNDGKYNPIGRWYAAWFYKQLESHLNRYRRGSTKTAVEYIPLREYYHRHNRSFFWELEDIIPFGNNPLFRFLFGWMMPPEVALLKLTQPEAVLKLYNKAHVIQDLIVPIEKLTEAVDVFHQNFQVYPLWLCPGKIFNQPGVLKVHTDQPSQMFVDLGAYGSPKAKNFEAEASTRNIEQYVIKSHGFQMLYADIYTTPEEFRKMFDLSLNDKLRDTLPHCKEAFPEIYGKVNRKVRR